MIRQLLRGAAVLAFAFAAFPDDLRAETSLSPAEERGRAIYLTGQSESGEEILAYFGDERFELPSSSMTCGGCHGPDGTGRPESGIVPPDIGWAQLTRSYGHRHAESGHHPAFDASSLGHYLRTGIYPGGVAGDPSMPTYRISDRDLADLVAYLVRLGEDLGPGVGTESILIGTIVPLAGPLAEAGDALRSLLDARIQEANAGGGIHGRRLELIVHESGSDPDTATRRARDWLEGTAPFALLSPFTLGLDGELQSLAAELEIPVVGPVTLFPVESYAANRHLFYIFSGLMDQMQALVRYTAERLGEADPAVALAHSPSTPPETLNGVLRILEQRGWQDLRSMTVGAAPADGAAALAAQRDEGIDLVVFLGSEPELDALLAEIGGWPAAPTILASGMLAGRAPFASGNDARIYLSYPTLPQDREGWAVEELARLLGGRDPSRHLPVLANGFAATSVLLEGLRGAGRELRREKLESVLESLFRFETGLTPPLTFTRNRRVGARGAYIVTPGETAGTARDFEVSPWVEVQSDSH